MWSVKKARAFNLGLVSLTHVEVTWCIDVTDPGVLC